MTTYIPYGRQSICQDDIAEIQAVLSSDWLTQGPTIQRFENAVSSYCQVDYGVAVSSATAALHLACLALGLEAGDHLWTSPNSFVASANCGLYCGATVDFVDIDLSTYNMSVSALTEKLKYAAINNCLPKIVVPVHFAGLACDMAEIYQLSKQYGFKIIEDASHAIGGSYQNQKIGACEYSDLTVFSFHPVKLITTGEGGMIMTRDKNLYDKLLRLRTHGITREQAHMQNDNDIPWYYEQIELGFNYRMTDIQAALGVSQLKKLDRFISLRETKRKLYDEHLTGLPIITPQVTPQRTSAWHLYVIQLQLEKLNVSRLQIFKALRAANIGVNVHYIPIHKQPYYQQLGIKQFANAEFYYERALTLPLYPDMQTTDQMRVINLLHECLL